MNNLSSKNRRYLYLVAIVLLYIPIMLLGLPASDNSEGGSLARLRTKYDLGESAIGQVDPSSSTMNLLLLGMRGIATNQLWLQADEYKKTKNWASLKSTVESIIKLQPHYTKVWEFQGWNLAFNVSVEWDAVEDRYYWVKEGAKFLMRGCERNDQSPELHWHVGNVHGKKIGRSDEWSYFRKFYLEDPNKDKFEGPDPGLNPEGIDNYLVAKEWFEKANEREKKVAQHIMMPVLFRHYPSRSTLDYADALHREGNFGERSLKAWEDGYNELTTSFGKMRIEAPGCEVVLEADNDTVNALAEEFDVSPDVIARWVFQYQKVCNYNYWRARSSIESEELMMNAHRDVYEGVELYQQGKLRQARKKLLDGLIKFNNTIQLIAQRNPGLQITDIDENLAEEILLGLIYFGSTYDLTGEKPPLREQVPLYSMITSRPDIYQRAVGEFQFQNRTKN